jgi:AAA+ ATPase superfamily predicted ATPase
MGEIVGRKNELEILDKLFKSTKSEFLALYGRRRVGKTFLVRNAFRGKFSFQITGLANASLQQQLTNFQIALQKYDENSQAVQAGSWIQAFNQLIQFLEKSKTRKKVVFIDELPWFDTRNSGFIQALEHFWNSWASARNDILLIACGSATSWMINKLINNKGGLHNRVTNRMKLHPFTLAECEGFLKSKKIKLDRYQLIQLYMVFGGVPYYWEQVEAGQSATQMIDRLCFSNDGLLVDEFLNLYYSLFNKPEKHMSIVSAMIKKSMGLTRQEIVKYTGLPNAGSTTRLLEELELSGFIRKYAPFGKKKRDSLYQLVDFYTHFYLRFIKGSGNDISNYWLTMIDSPRYRVWSGYAFEQICLYHSQQIMKSLGISGVQTSLSSWRSKTAQIDLLIDRRDQVINLCEMKYSINSFRITKKYAEELRNKVGAFKSETKTRKSIFLTMITSFGIQKNEYYGALVQNELVMDDLFNDA